MSEEVENEVAEDTPLQITEADPELEAMFKAGVHFGYSRSRRHPKMGPYIFGLRHNVEVFDLEKVRTQLDRALDYVIEISKKGEVMLFVGTKPAVQTAVEETAGKIGMPFMTDRWIGGLLTNFYIIRKRMDYFEELKEAKRSGELSKYKKKEIVMKEKELERLEHNFRGVVQLRRRPAALFVVDPAEEITAVHEAQRLSIPVIAIANNDVNPTLVDYVIPANDSARSSVAYILDKVMDAWKKGKEQAPAETPQASEVTA
ncbi:MAG: 30S ribosomal protein S2 [Candidatus Niyogibacteria bacterium CG10_big_fil_rev_8_21_14_0_10_46_36]|uniref:Small ribosomal subunit protein uS2 n=1 Tax=Candidatus Niyogibacteria bacterium CG10_big_fil_rev_8_21_14_0_10_46_36 TaxID=1974726 RepID=A0A2H0TD71_9BACT|nr:MAG: 30S ribosomal protein S2 [Candidatus Niyogibacteria bacterium CG10_big_fil_rev_8_21_14_0_10_46_36]